MVLTGAEEHELRVKKGNRRVSDPNQQPLDQGDQSPGVGTAGPQPRQDTAGATQAPARSGRRGRRGPLGLVSIQSKLIVVLVLYSVLTAVVVGVIAFQAGRSSLREAAFNRLTEIRQSQTQALDSELSDLKNSLIMYTHGVNLEGAIREFTAGFDELAGAKIDPAQSQAIDEYYRKFTKAAEEHSGSPLDANALLPTSNAQRYLQAHYTVRRTDGDSPLTAAQARDDSAWSVANGRYQDFFSEIVNRFEFQDALLLDTRGNIIFCSDQNVDLGSNIVTGPYQGSNLRGAYERALAANSADYVGFTDFELYQPAGNQPTAWMLSPVAPDGRTLGVLALQFPISKVNRLMTFDGRWLESGLGKTGETFIVGVDGLMRSDSRLFLENPEQYKHDVIEAGTPPDVAETAIRLGGTGCWTHATTSSAAGAPGSATKVNPARAAIFPLVKTLPDPVDTIPLVTPGTNEPRICPTVPPMETPPATASASAAPPVAAVATTNAAPSTAPASKPTRASECSMGSPMRAASGIRPHLGRDGALAEANALEQIVEGTPPDRANGPLSREREHDDAIPEPDHHLPLLDRHVVLHPARLQRDRVLPVDLGIITEP